MVKVVIALAVVLGIALLGISMIEGSGDQVTASAQLIAPSTDLAGYARAIDAYAWDFPRDFGAHNAFQTEWWYYTGNLATDDGRRFGYQFTIFRRAIAPENSESDSEFRTNQIYMAHFTVSDIAGQRFYHEQRFSRGAAGLAFALPDDGQPDAAYQVVLDNWRIEAGDAPNVTTITAQADGFAIDLTLADVKGVALQGQDGLSPKSDEPGNASYYYSQPRQLTTGTLALGGEAFVVSGASWKDHEFSTSALGPEALGWDWFGLQFDDGRELMVGQIRQVDGGKEPAFGGLLIEADGSTRYLNADDFTITPTGTWQSPHTGATYPAGWGITLNGADGFTFAVTPLQADQELYDSEPAYWEGAVALSGGVTGYGYAELTGYADAMTDRF